MSYGDRGSNSQNMYMSESITQDRFHLSGIYKTNKKKKLRVGFKKKSGISNLQPPINLVFG